MILKGNIIEREIFAKLKAAKTPRKKLVVISIGEDQASVIYVAKKQEMATQLGVGFEVLKLSAKISEEELQREIDRLNNDEDVGGVLIQMPIPNHLNRKSICGRIFKEKDVDGFSYIISGSGVVLPPTVLAIDALLNFYKIEKQSSKIVIVGKGFLVGSPLYEFYKKRGLDVEVLEEYAQDYAKKIKDAKIVILATGGNASFTAVDFSEGSTVVDASTVASDNKLKGDLKTDGFNDGINYSPVPGGVGPITVAMLFVNFFLLNGCRVEGFPVDKN